MPFKEFVPTNNNPGAKHTNDRERMAEIAAAVSKKARENPINAKSKEKEASSQLGKRTNQQRAPSKICMTDHGFLVYEFAMRWNYALPKYPPENYDYTQ